MSSIEMTAYPVNREAQKRFDKCKKGDVVWFPGGYTIAGDWQSFGRRATVIEVRTGPKGGVMLKPDNDPNQLYHVGFLITRHDILSTLEKRETQEEKDAYLAKFQLQPDDLVAQTGVPSKEQKDIARMTKPELIARVRALESELAELKSKLAPA